MAFALSAHFVLQTVLLNRISPLWLTAAEVVVAAVVVLILGVIAGEGTTRPNGAAVALGVGLGIAGLWLTEALVVTHRLTDAPSGSESLFFTTAVWALPVAAAASFRRQGRPTWAQWAGVLVGLLGAAAILANWERPSSFSPLVKFPVLEAWLMAAGVLWAMYGAVLARVRTVRPATLLLPAALSAAAIGAVSALLFGGPLPTDALAENLVGVVAAGVSLGFAWIAWTWIAQQRGEMKGVAPLIVPAVLLSLFALTERLGVVYGPRPLLVLPAAGAGVIALFGAAASWPVDLREGPARPTSAAKRFLLAFAVACVAVGAVALVTSRLSAVVTGELADGSPYYAAWKYIGAETAGGWMAMLFAVAFLARLLTPAARRTLILWALAGAIALVAYLPLADTPLRTWTRWLPAEVQQDYGTAYAQLRLRPLVSWPERAAVLGSAVGLIALAALSRPGIRKEGFFAEPHA